MLAQADSYLRQWVVNCLGEIPISFAPPNDQLTGKGVSLFLLELLETPPASTNTIAPVQFSARYLVTTWGEPEQAHQLLGELVLAALEGLPADMEMALETVPAQLWLALHVLPRPSFFLHLLIRKPRPEPEIKYVTQPLVIEMTPTTALVGVVLGSGAMPMVGARIECPALDLSTVTDQKGRFRFGNVPASLALRLIIKAKGRQLSITTHQLTSDEHPLIIQF